MRLGARWRVGDPPHSSVPVSLHDAIAAQEAAHPGASAWTLTWLEGRPRLDLDELVTVALAATGEVLLEGGEGDDTDDDAWLR